MIGKKFSENIISKIEEKNLKPKPRWEFVFKNYFLWIIGVLSLLFGALSFSLIIYLFNSKGTVFSDKFGASSLEIFLVVIPIFWLAFLALFIFLFYLNLKKTKRAYKYSPFLILIIGLIFSIVLGISFYALGFSKKLDSVLGRNINPVVYGRFMNPQLAFWSEPEKGRLSGVVSELRDHESFYLVDKDSKEWLVVYKNLPPSNILRIEKGLTIRSFGEKIADEQFNAIRIMPMHSASDFFNRPGIRRKINDPMFRSRMESRNKMKNVYLSNNNCLLK
jgi:hypothetical protein